VAQESHWHGVGPKFAHLSWRGAQAVGRSGEAAAHAHCAILVRPPPWHTRPAGLKVLKTVECHRLHYVDSVPPRPLGGREGGGEGG
jgi:hypothetical protein